MTPADALSASAPADPDISGSALLGSALSFGRVLKEEGLAADLATVLDYVRALELVDIGDREEVRAAGEALFVRRREEIEPYRRAFARFWRRAFQSRPTERTEPRPDARPSSQDGRPAPAVPQLTLAKQDAAATTTEAAGDEQAEGFTASHLAYSAGERLRHRSFERMTNAELREAERLIDAMAVRMPLRRTRRWELHRGGTLLAPRQMLRRNLATGGDPGDVAVAAPRAAPPQRGAAVRRQRLHGAARAAAAALLPRAGAERGAHRGVLLRHAA